MKNWGWRHQKIQEKSVNDWGKRKGSNTVITLRTIVLNVPAKFHRWCE